jgi:predicted Fe-Mo cluster-binding NifX family protein
MNPVETTKRTYDTTDLSLASFLRCRSFIINDIRRQNGKTIFVFEDSSQLRTAVLDYANDGSVSVRTFCSTMRDLKAITR